MEAPSQAVALNGGKSNFSDGSFQAFYRYITIEMLSTNNMKFWLACQAVFSMRCTARRLYRVIYDDFLRRAAPYRISVKVSTVEKIRICLDKPGDMDPRSFSNMEKLFKAAQMDISFSQLRSIDLCAIFDLTLGASIQQHQSSTRATAPSSTYKATKDRPGQMYRLSNLDMHDKPPQEGFHQEVYRRLLQVQEERRRMLKKAKQEATLAGKDSSNLDWYDFSGHQNKYQW